MFGSMWNLLVSFAANAGPAKHTTARNRSTALASPAPNAIGARAAERACAAPQERDQQEDPHGEHEQSRPCCCVWLELRAKYAVILASRVAACRATLPPMTNATTMHTTRGDARRAGFHA